MNNRREKHTVLLEGKPRVYIVRRNSRTRINIRISMDGEIVVSAPDHVPVPRIEEALLKRESWILTRIRKHHSLRSTAWDSLRFRGVAYSIHATGIPSQRIIIDGANKKLLVPEDPSTSESARAGIISTLKREAKSYLSKRIQTISGIIQVPYKGLFVRNQRTRWGSSSYLGNININWRVIMAPDRVIDYLIIHELMHQVHRNHSKQFWKAVEQVLPDCHRFDLWLKKNSYLLALFR